MRRLLPLLFLLGCGPQQPFVCAPVPQLTVFVGEWAEADLCFADPDGGELDLVSVIHDTIPVAQVQLTFAGKLRVLGRWPGSTTITVTATDPDGLAVEANVPVLVPNRPPHGSLADLEIPAGFVVTIYLTDHFSDPDGQPLSYSASSSAPSVVDVAASSDSLLRLTPLADEGSARISVTVSDGQGSVTTTFEATVVPTRVVLSDEFDSDASLDDWTLADYSAAAIRDGYLVLTADSARHNGMVTQDFGGSARDWLVDITLRTTEAGAQAGFLVYTGRYPLIAYQFLLGDAEIPGLPRLNWAFAWWDDRVGHWVTDDWAHGISGHIRDFADAEVSLSMTRKGIRATVDGKLLFEHRSLVSRAIALALLTRPEGAGGVASSMNRVRFVTREFTEDSGANANAWPHLADKHIIRWR